MKKIIILFLLTIVLFGCENRLNYPLVVSKVEKISGPTKYCVHIQSFYLDKGSYFYSDSLYQVGDTLK